MRIIKITLLASILFCSLLFYIGHQMTVEPGTNSGNGNPAILIVWILMPLFILNILMTLKLIRHFSLVKKVSITSISILVILTITGFIYRYFNHLKFIDFARASINEPLDESYLQDITSGFNIHTNNQYFNLTTFFIFLAITAIISLIWHLWDLIDKETQDSVHDPDVI